MPVQSAKAEPNPGTKLTGWLFTDARVQSPCSRCNAGPGEHCRQPKGRKAMYPHPERMKVTVERFGANTWQSGLQTL